MADEGQYTTYAEWDMKSILLNQYAIAYNNLVDHIVQPDNHKVKLEARKSVLKLMYPLFPKIYVLGEKWEYEKDYIAHFMRNPHDMELLELQSTFLVMQHLMEKLGITKFEKYQLPEVDMYKEE